jgi:tripartite-type tricarboxylate transporter receptor subunit TctC
VKSFAPITRIGSTSFVLLGTIGLPAGNLAELIAYAKANSGKLNVANVGTSTLGYLMTLQLRALTGTEMTDIYYKGSSQTYPDLISGQVQLFLDNPGASTPLVTSGKLRAYGVTTPTPSMPGVPLFSEAGLKGYDTSFWYGLVAPAGTPKAIVDRIQTEVAKYVHSPEGKTEFAARSLEPGGDSPEQFTHLIQAEMERFRALAAQFKLKPQ